MTVGELIEVLANCDPSHYVIVRSGKHGFKEARVIEPGFFNRQAGDFQTDVEGEGGTDSVLINE